MKYLIVEDSADDFCSFHISDDIDNDMLDKFMIGDIQIINLLKKSFLVEFHRDNLNDTHFVWQKIPEK